MRSDSLVTSLGKRSTGLRRLWVEDSFSRLTNNGFEIGTGFVVEPRMGPGVNIRPSLLARCHVSQRRGAAILSYEGNESMARFHEPEVRVKISVGLVQVIPSLRVFSVRTPSSVVWKIDGSTLTTEEGSMALRDGLERPAGRPATIEACLNAQNIVAATALIAWAKPGTIRLIDGSAPVGQLDLFADAAPSAPAGSDKDAAITAEVARQFFVACGYEMAQNGVFRR